MQLNSSQKDNHQGDTIEPYIQITSPVYFQAAQQIKKIKSPCETLRIHVKNYYNFSYWNARVFIHISEGQSSFSRCYMSNDQFPPLGKALKQKKQILKQTKVLQIKFNHDLVAHGTWNQIVEAINNMEQLQTLKLLMRKGNKSQQKNWTQQINQRINLIIQKWD